MVWSVHDIARYTKIKVMYNKLISGKVVIFNNPLTLEVLKIATFTEFLHSTCICVTLRCLSRYWCDSVKLVETPTPAHHIYLRRNVGMLCSYQSIHSRLVGDYKHNLCSCSSAWVCCGINKRLQNIIHLLVFTGSTSSRNMLDICFQIMCYIYINVLMFGVLTFCGHPF
jgi:hypothetical protein